MYVFCSGAHVSTLNTDTNIRVSKATASRALEQFVKVVYSKAHNFIQFPKGKTDILQTMSEFQTIAGKFDS